MTKSKGSMAMRDILYLTTDAFLDVMITKNFPLLSVGSYLFRVVIDNRYLPRGNNDVVLLALLMYLLAGGSKTIPLLEFTMIYCIH